MTVLRAEIGGGAGAAARAGGARVEDNRAADSDDDRGDVAVGTDAGLDGLGPAEVGALAGGGAVLGVDLGGSSTKVVLVAGAPVTRAVSDRSASAADREPRGGLRGDDAPGDGHRRHDRRGGGVPGDQVPGDSVHGDGVHAGAVLAQQVLPGRLTADGLPALAATLLATARSAGVPLAGVGVTVPGVLDERTGVVRRSVNLPWLDGRDLGADLSAALADAGVPGVPVRAVHDGRAAALAEAVLGAGRGAPDVYVVTLGTGVAGAHVVDGHARPGAHGSAGELGHVSLDPEGTGCGCGQRGCLETVVGAPHLLRRWHAAGGTGDDVAALSAAAVGGDPTAAAVLDEAADALAAGLLALLAVVDPGLVVLGGGVGESEPLRSRLATALLARATFHVVPDVVPAALGRWAGARGAALVAGPLAPAG